jgi:hypothetical protein
MLLSIHSECDADDFMTCRVSVFRMFFRFRMFLHVGLSTIFPVVRLPEQGGHTEYALYKSINQSITSLVLVRARHRGSEGARAWRVGAGGRGR